MDKTSAMPRDSPGTLVFSSFLTPAVVGGHPLFPLKFVLKVTHPLSRRLADPPPLGAVAPSAALFSRLRRSPLGAFGVSVAFETVPLRMLRATPLSQHVIGSCEACRCARKAIVRPAFVACADFLKVGHFAPFSQFLHIKGRNFQNVFFPFTSAYNPYAMNHKKFDGNGPRVFEKSGTQTHRQSQ